MSWRTEESSEKCMEQYFQVKMAGKAIGVYPMTAKLVSFCKDYLTEEVPEFTIRVTQSDIEWEREQSTIKVSDSYLETLALCRKVAAEMLSYEILFFHGSCVAVDGEAYLFTAPSGTGKSTHTRLWREQFGDRVVMVNDDKPFLKIEEEGVTVYGSPWNGAHGLGANMQVPLKAVCLLHREEENHIETVTPEQAFPRLFSESYRAQEKEDREQILRLVDRLTRKAALYSLGCNMEPEAARVSFAALCGSGARRSVHG